MATAMVMGAGLPLPAAPAEAAGSGFAAGSVPVAGRAVARTGGLPINVRAGASTAHARVGTLPDGSRLAVACQVRGQLVGGHVRRTDLWNRLRGGRYVADANVAWSGPPPRRCGPAGTGARSVPATVSTGGIALNVRSGPSAGHRRLGSVPNGSRLSVACRVTGAHVAGHVRRTAVWDRLTSGAYVSDAYVRWAPGRVAPPCRSAPAPVAGDPIATDPATFIARLAGPARRDMRRHGVPASVTIAQAILESGWGRSRLAYGDNNYFGIKCFGGPGPVAVGCRSYPTSECSGDRCFATRASFRVYGSLADSVRDHGRFLAVDNPRYRPAFAYRRSPDRFVVAIHRAGYATSPTYARALIALMRQYRLYRYDR